MSTHRPFSSQWMQGSPTTGWQSGFGRWIACSGEQVKVKFGAMHTQAGWHIPPPQKPGSHRLPSTRQSALSVHVEGTGIALVVVLVVVVVSVVVVVGHGTPRGCRRQRRMNLVTWMLGS